jgi:hypothetical protein
MGRPTEPSRADNRRSAIRQRWIEALDALERHLDDMPESK